MNSRNCAQIQPHASFEVVRHFISKSPKCANLSNGPSDQKPLGYFEALSLLHQMSSEVSSWKYITENYVLKNLQKKEAFLDVGIGTGELTRFLIPFFHKGHLVDQSLHPLRSFQILAPRITTHCMKIETFTPENLNFDFINLSHVLYYVHPQDISKIIEKLIKRLNANGKLMIVVSEGLDKQNLIETFGGATFNLEIPVLKVLQTVQQSILVDAYYVREEIISPNIQDIYSIADIYLNDAHIQAEEEDLKKFILHTCKNENNHYVLNTVQKFMVVSL